MYHSTRVEGKRVTLIAVEPIRNQPQQSFSNAGTSAGLAGHWLG